MSEVLEGKTKAPQAAGKFKNRNRMEIVANLLSIAKTGSLKTHLMYQANLSYVMVTDYLKFLRSSDLIAETVNEEGGRIYVTTPRGLKYLEVYESLQSITGLDAQKAKAASPDLFS